MKRILSICLVTLAPHLWGAVQVVTSTTDLAWAVKEIGGDHVEVTSFLKGIENPHFVDAVPEFIRLTAEANLACIVGLDLEIGWIPKVFSRSGNAQIQPGGKGFCETGKSVSVLERPQGGVDRSMGDVHPSGNPHYWLSPKHFSEAAKEIYEGLVRVDPVNAAKYQNGYKRFTEVMEEILKKNRAKLHPYTVGRKSPVLIEYHKEFAYFLDAYDLKSYGSIEEKPGVSPSAGRLAEVAMATKAAGIQFILAADTSPKKTVEKFSELSQIPALVVPLSIQPNGKIKSYRELQENLVDQIVEILKKSLT